MTIEIPQEFLPKKQTHKKYDPNFYFFTDEQFKLLKSWEDFLVSMEVMCASVLTTDENPILEITFEDFNAALTEMIIMHNNYRKLLDIFRGPSDILGLIDTEHLINLASIGTKNLPELDDVTLRYINQTLLVNLINRIYNCFLNLIVVLQKFFPDKKSEIMNRVKDFEKLNLTDTSLIEPKRN